MTKYIVYATLLSAIGVSVAVIDSRNVDYQPTSQGPYDTDEVYAMGIVEGLTEDVQLRPEVAGRVVELHVKVGDWVDTGDVLLQLDQQRQTQQVAASKAHLELAEAQLERLVNGARDQERDEARALLSAKQARHKQARLTLDRLQELRKQNAVTQQEFDDQTGLVEALSAEVDAAQAQVEQLDAPARADELRVAQARVAAAEADYELATIALDKTSLKAPRRGQVLDLNVEPGELLSADDPTPAVVLSDTSTLRIRAFVEEIDAPKLKVGTTASVTADGLPGQAFAGRITSLSPRMSAKTVSSGRPDELYDTKVREVIITLEDAEQLLVGLRVDVKFTAAEQ